MDKINIADELIELKTIQVLLDDKLHRFQDLLNRLDKRIDALEKYAGGCNELIH